jgi:Glycosyl hydrolase family 76
VRNPQAPGLFGFTTMRRTSHRPPRWRSLALALAAGIALGTAAPAPAATKPAAKPPAAHHKPKPPPLPVDEQRAIASYQAMQSAFYVPGARLYRGNPYTTLWPYGQALAATVDMSDLPKMHTRYQPDLQARLGGLQSYWAYGVKPPVGYVFAVGHSYTTSGARYFDDNEWIAMDLLRLYQHDHLAELLPTAEQIFQLVITAWDDAPVRACPGGIPFTDLAVNGDRNTTTNAPAAELAAELYLVTGQLDYLAWAGKLYGWVRDCLLKADGLYADHVNAKGQIDQTEWTYNQGSMIGAGALLFQATRDVTFLEQAEQTAAAAIARFSGSALDSQPPPFDAIYARNLLLVDAVTNSPLYTGYLQSYADRRWAYLRQPGTGLFGSSASGDTQLLDSAGMVEVYAMLSEPLSVLF